MDRQTEVTKKYTLEQIYKTLQAKKYKIHMDYWYPNFIGVRQETSTNSFDDLFILLQHTPDGVVHEEYSFTTDPGEYALQHPTNIHGTGTVVPGYYPKLWIIGYHKGKYEAFRQNGLIKVYRDNNKDSIMDFDPETIEEGVFGVNMHKAGFNSVLVDKWSYLCQVFKKASDFNRVLDIAKRSGVNRFDYYLLESKDFNISP